MKGLSASIGGVQVGGQQVTKTAASARPAAETQTRHAAAVTGSRRATPSDLGAAHGGRTECGRAIGRADGRPGTGKGLKGLSGKVPICCTLGALTSPYRLAVCTPLHESYHVA